MKKIFSKLCRLIGLELIDQNHFTSPTLNKELNEDNLFSLELNAFMKLIQTHKTQERIKHTLETGKPLVN